MTYTKKVIDYFLVAVFISLFACLWRLFRDWEDRRDGKTRMIIQMEDRLTPEQLAAVKAASDVFKASAKRRRDEHVFYDGLTNAGVKPEEADEIINLTLDAEEEG